MLKLHNKRFVGEYQWQKKMIRTMDAVATKAAHELILLTNNLSVPKITEIGVGQDVVLIPGRSFHRFSYGTPDEALGVVTNTHPENPLYFEVKWALRNDVVHEYHAREELLAYVDVVNFLEAHPEIVNEIDFKFKTSDIIYVKPVPHELPSSRYPCIGSEYETDVKIIDFYHSRFKSCLTYKVYNPNYGYITLRQDSLVPMSDYCKYKHPDVTEIIVQEDLLPFFSKGETVRLIKGVVSNISNTVEVPLTEELKKLIL